MQLAFFRRHRRFFMVLMVLAVVSMVFFGTVTYVWDHFVGWLGGGSNPEVGLIDGRTVHHREVAEFYRTVRIGAAASRWIYFHLGPNVQTSGDQMTLWFHALARSIWPLAAASVFLEDRPEGARLLTWLALYEEARHWGFDATDAEVDARLEALRGAGLTQKGLDRLLSREAGGDREAFYEGLRADMTLRAYVDWLLETTGVAVEPELRRRFIRMDERVKVRLAVLKAEDFLSKAPEPKDDEVQKQFDAYKAFLPGYGPKGFGYRIPNRVKMEYLVTDPAAFEKDAEGRVTQEEVEAYYEAHKDPEFVVADTPTEGEPAASEPPTDQPEEKVFRPLQEVRDDIRRRLVEAEARRLASERMQNDVAEIRAIQEPPDLRIWADGTFVTYEAIADFQTETQLAVREGIGSAVRERATLAETALALVELVGQERAQLAAQEISEAFTDAGGRMYAFRVTGYETDHEPAALQEVRDQVVADLKMEWAAEAATSAAQKLLESAEEKGLEAAAKKAKVKVEETEWFPRERFVPAARMGRSFTMPPSLPVVGANPVVVAECFRLDPETKPRSLVILAQQGWSVVVEFVGREAPSEERYKAMRPFLAREVGAALKASASSDMLDEEAVRRRLGVVWAPAEVEAEPVPEGEAEPGDE